MCRLYSETSGTCSKDGFFLKPTKELSGDYQSTQDQYNAASSIIKWRKSAQINKFAFDFSLCLDRIIVACLQCRFDDSQHAVFSHVRSGSRGLWYTHRKFADVGRLERPNQIWENRFHR